jgi:hypothetical protein
MAGELVPQGGYMQPMNAGEEIHNTLMQNWENRGRKAAILTVASLAESAYRPVIDGIAFGIEVGDIPDLTKLTPEGIIPSAPSTTRVAANTIQEYLSAEVPGVQSTRLELLWTKYGQTLKALTPSFRTPSPQSDAFEGCFVGMLRELYGVPIKTLPKRYA